MDLLPFLLAAHLTLLAGTPPATEQTDQFAGVYLCTPEASGGVAYSGGKWVGTSFSLEVPKIITLKSVGPTSDVDTVSGTPAPATAYQVTIATVGRKQPLACRTDSQPDGTVIVREYQAAFSCFSALELYTVNLNTMRFRIAYLGGYTDGRDADSDTPAITIGKCGKID
jgi:hypothetical protein